MKMAGMLDDFGVQSYCFRGFKDNARVASMVREIGVSAIEVCAVHADFSDPDAWKKTVDTYAAAGVSICSIGVQTLTGNEAAERPWFECVRAAGARHMSVHFNVDTFSKAIPMAAGLAEEYDIRLAIHCHGGYKFGGSADVMEHLLNLGGPRIGVGLDTAWCMQTGPRHGNPLQWVKRFAGRIYGVHFKDFVFEPDGQWRDMVIGEGNLDTAAFIKALQETGFDGFSVIEYEADVNDPVPALSRCVQAIRPHVSRVVAESR